MGRTTNLYDESVETVIAAEESDELDFGGGASLYLDKSGFGLGFLSDVMGARRGLMYEPCLVLGDAEVRFFMPEDVADLQRCLTVAAITRQLDRNKYEAMTSARVYPFDANDLDYEFALIYLVSYVEQMEKFLKSIVANGRAIVSVTS